jgi:hypothetical protein
MVNFTLRPLYPQERTLLYNEKEDFEEEKIIHVCRNLNPG